MSFKRFCHGCLRWLIPLSPGANFSENCCPAVSSQGAAVWCTCGWSYILSLSREIPRNISTQQFLALCCSWLVHQFCCWIKVRYSLWEQVTNYSVGGEIQRNDLFFFTLVLLFNLQMLWEHSLQSLGSVRVAVAGQEKR